MQQEHHCVSLLRLILWISRILLFFNYFLHYDEIITTNILKMAVGSLELRMWSVFTYWRLPNRKRIVNYHFSFWHNHTFCYPKKLKYEGKIKPKRRIITNVIKYVCRFEIFLKRKSIFSVILNKRKQISCLICQTGRICKGFDACSPLWLPKSYRTTFHTEF